MDAVISPREDSFETGSVSSLDLPSVQSAASRYRKGRFLVTLFPKAERFQQGRFKVTLFHCHKPAADPPVSPSTLDTSSASTPIQPAVTPQAPSTQSPSTSTSPSASPTTHHKHKNNLKTLFCCNRPRSRSFDPVDDQDGTNPLAVGQKLERHSVSTLLLSSVDDQPTHPNAQCSSPYLSPMSSHKDGSLQTMSSSQTPRRSLNANPVLATSSYSSLGTFSQSQPTERHFRPSQDSAISKFPSTALSCTSQDYLQSALQHTNTAGSSHLSSQLGSAQLSSQLSSQLSAPKPSLSIPNAPPPLSLGPELGHHNRCGSEPLMAPSSPVDSVSSFAHRASLQSMSTPDVTSLTNRHWCDQNQKRQRLPETETVLLCSNTDGHSVAGKHISLQSHCLYFGRPPHAMPPPMEWRQQQVETKGRFKITTARSGMGSGALELRSLSTDSAATPLSSTATAPTPTGQKKGRFTVYENC